MLDDAFVGTRLVTRARRHVFARVPECKKHVHIPGVPRTAVPPLASGPPANDQEPSSFMKGLPNEVAKGQPVIRRSMNTKLPCGQSQSNVISLSLSLSQSPACYCRQQLPGISYTAASII